MCIYVRRVSYTDVCVRFWIWYNTVSNWARSATYRAAVPNRNPITSHPHLYTLSVNFCLVYLELCRNRNLYLLLNHVEIDNKYRPFEKLAILYKLCNWLIFFVISFQSVHTITGWVSFVLERIAIIFNGQFQIFFFYYYIIFERIAATTKNVRPLLFPYSVYVHTYHSIDMSYYMVYIINIMINSINALKIVLLKIIINPLNLLTPGKLLLNFNSFNFLLELYMIKNLGLIGCFVVLQ